MICVARGVNLPGELKPLLFLVSTLQSGELSMVWLTRTSAELLLNKAKAGQVDAVDDPRLMRCYTDTAGCIQRYVTHKSSPHNDDLLSSVHCLRTLHVDEVLWVRRTH
jgi:hypothetical protein